MKDHLKQILQGVNQSALAQYLVREYLQARLLQVLQDEHLDLLQGAGWL